MQMPDCWSCWPARSRRLALLLVLAACRPTDALDPRSLRVALQIPVASFRPNASNQFEAALLTGAVFEGLTASTEDGRVAPALASRWTTVDGRHWRFELRPDVYFHDGTRFAARHVVASWEHALQTASPGNEEHPWVLDHLLGADEFKRGARRDIPGLRIVDDSTLDVVLRSPSAAWPEMLATWALRIAGPGSSDSTMNGTGPWRHVRGRPGDSTYVFARNGTHRGASTAMDSLIFWVATAGNFEARLEAGWLDCMAGADDWPPLLLRTDLRIQSSVPHVVRMVAWNHRHPLVRQPAFRQAVSLALDRTALLRTTETRGAVVRASLLSPGVVPWDTAPGPVRPDPVRAAALLEGMDLGVPLRIAWALPDTTVPLLQAFRSQLATLGVRTRLVHPSGAPMAAFVRDSVDLLLWRWLPPHPGADALLYQLFHSKASSGLANAFGFADAAVDRALDAERALISAAARDSAIVALGQRLYESGPGLLLWHETLLTASSRRLAGCPDLVHGGTFTTVTRSSP